MGPLPPLPIDKLFYLAVFGVICAVVLALGGVGFAIWWAVNHIQIV